jgi:predicted  nucleic acid-binding Zn-ribbon protein
MARPGAFVPADEAADVAAGADADNGGPVGGGEPGAGGVFEILLAVQDLDTQLSQLAHRRVALPARVELDGVQGQLAELTARAAEPRAARDTVAARLDELQRQVEATVSRRTALEGRMYAAGAPARDLRAMDEEVRHLRQRASQLEEVELEAMEEQEGLDTQLATVAAEEARLAAAAAGLRVSVADAEEVIDAEIAAVRARREAEAARLPADLAALYESLRVRLHGTGAALLVGNRCEGCHLELPAVEIDRIRRLPVDELVTCDQCGRILVRSRRAAG